MASNRELLIFNRGVTEIVPYPDQFVVKMRGSHVKPSCLLHVPVKYQLPLPLVTNHPEVKEIPCQVRLVGARDNDQKWEGAYCVDKSKLHRISYFCWRDFVMANNVRKGDSVLFILRKDLPILTFCVKVIKGKGSIPLAMFERERGTKFLHASFETSDSETSDSEESEEM